LLEKMNILIKCALFVTLAVLPEIITAQGAQPAEPWFSVTIVGPKASVSVGSDVRLKVTFVNNTEQDIRYPGAGLPTRNGPVFDIDIRDSGGKPAQETTYGLRMHGKDVRPWSGGSVFAATAHPGDKIEEELILSKEFDMSNPGDYTVQVRERNPKLQVVKSNSITITVVP
jgi:hypothetical protein